MDSHYIDSNVVNGLAIFGALCAAALTYWICLRVANFLARKQITHQEMLRRFVGDGRNNTEVFTYYLKHKGIAEITNAKGMWGYAKKVDGKVAFGFRYTGRSGAMSVIRIASMPWHEFTGAFNNVSIRNKAWHALYSLLKKIEEEKIAADNFESEIYAVSVAKQKIDEWL